MKPAYVPRRADGTPELESAVKPARCVSYTIVSRQLWPSGRSPSQSYAPTSTTTLFMEGVSSARSPDSTRR